MTITHLLSMSVLLPRTHTLWSFPGHGPQHSVVHRPFLARAQNKNSPGDAPDQSTSPTGGERLWRKELLQQQLEEPDSLFDESFLSRTVEQDMKESRQRPRNQAQQNDASEQRGFLSSLVEKLLVADFFFILFILAWFIAGLAEKAAFDTSSLIDAWLPLWPVLFQPALGLFMGGAIWTAVSKFLFSK